MTTIDKDTPAAHMRRPQKLTAEDARFIRQWYADGQKPSAIARVYMVHRNTVWHIVSGRTWREAPNG